MKKETIKIISILAGVVLFDVLFWKEGAGVNFLCFATSLLIALFSFKPHVKDSKFVVVTTTTILLSAVLVIANNTFLNEFTLYISYILLIGFCYQPGLKSVIAALPTGLANFFVAQFSFFKASIDVSPLKANLSPAGRYIRLSILPVAVVILFYVIYRSANPIFLELSKSFFKNISDWIGRFFQDVSVVRIMFLCFGGFIIIGILFDGAIKRFAEWETKRKDSLSPQWTEDSPSVLQPGSIYSLRDEYTIGSLLFGLLNLLILVVNVIDIRWLWFGFEYEPGMDLSQMVHEGTYLLIFSIVLAMAIIFYFFRGNLNFIPNNKRLQYLTYLWIVQNMIMVISVAVRNIYYINYYHSLTYKRIGVMIFLAMTLIGLITLAIKVWKKRSAYYLFRVNSWAALTLMIVLSFGNWDGIIAKHNLSNPNPNHIDLAYLLSLSDKVLPLLDQHRHFFDQRVPRYYTRRYGYIYYSEALDNRITKFFYKKDNQSWPSWNYPEYKAMQYFDESKIPNNGF